MADSLRTDGARAIDHASPGDRDAKIEQLLLAGLDHYFSARYEQAIDVWTRTLFFDRSHARARAYIDRARSALAERERQSEELLQKGAAALDRGHGDEARRLLHAAVESGAHAHDIHPLLERLSRQATTPWAGVDDPPPPVERQSAARHARTDTVAAERGATTRPGAWLMALVLGIVIAAAYTMAMRSGFDPLVLSGGREVPAVSATAPAARETALAVPRRGEMALGRARALEARGRLHEALAALEMVRLTDPEKAEADRVRADIQRQLLGMATRQP
jgi:tetratricopeptide (TPR) repeat protein